MGKSNRMLNKSTISKNELCDENFDKLVIDTSHKVTQKRLLNSKEQNSRARIETQQQHQQQQQLHSSNGSGNELGNSSAQPKRPMNAFMVWGQAIRRELHDKFSNVQNAMLSKALGRVWRSLSPTEKEPYITKANLIKANHKRDYPDYRYRPRRIQEKRAKCNMLIGIHLNHPVNQYPRQNNFNNFDQRFQSVHHVTDVQQFAQQQQQLHEQQQQQQQQKLVVGGGFKNGKDATMSLSGEMTQVESKDKRFFHGCEPYQSSIHFETSNNNQCRIQPIVDRNSLTRQGVVECHNECYQDYQQNIPNNTANKQPTEYTYPPYHQLTYNVHQQHYQYHHQSQSQSLHYEVPTQNNYLDAQTSSRVTNSMSGNIGSYCPSVNQVNQVKMYDHSSFNNYVI